jgi:hypothetical protein
MSCLIQLLEDQNDLLRTQVKNAALSHDAQHARITSLEAENARLREELDPMPPIMEGTFVPTPPSGEDALDES